MINSISSFNKENFFLSNFKLCEVTYEEEKYKSVEHAYVAAKTTDLKTRETIRNFETPAEAKKFGRQIELRDDWDKIKLNVMENLLRQKFHRGSELAQKLMKTWGYDLIEGNNWGDIFWGICDGKGKNYLGKILMRIRGELIMGEKDVKQ